MCRFLGIRGMLRPSLQRRQHFGLAFWWELGQGADKVGAAGSAQFVVPHQDVEGLLVVGGVLDVHNWWGELSLPGRGFLLLRLFWLLWLLLA
jgi:hypothetical protein